MKSGLNLKDMNMRDDEGHQSSKFIPMVAMQELEILTQERPKIS